MLIVNSGENSSDYKSKVLGGKGLKLLDLFLLQDDIGYITPKFFIIPSYFSDDDFFKSLVREFDAGNSEAESLFQSYKKPCIIRSSSPLEDSTIATFAGKFRTVKDIDNFSQLEGAIYQVLQSAKEHKVFEHTKSLGLKYTELMAVIVQEQVTDPIVHGTLQFKVGSNLFQGTDKNGNEFSFDCIDLFNEYLKTKFNYVNDNPDFIIDPAYKLKDKLNLINEVQIEFLINQNSDKPYFVQIRELPMPKSNSISTEEINIDIPPGTPYIIAEVFHEMNKDIVLPAYVTLSLSGFSTFLGRIEDPIIKKDITEKYKEIMNNSKININRDFHRMRYAALERKIKGYIHYEREFKKCWTAGNRLFEEYVLICDRLEEIPKHMNELTTNKRGIITTYDISITKHAITVSRDLSIPFLGVKCDPGDLKNFLHQIRTGDLIRIKCDRKSAVAYLEERRKVDPYMMLK